MTATPQIDTLPPDDSAAMSSNYATRLPFGFAKRFGVLVEGTHDQLKVLHRDGVSAAAIMEVQRFLSAPFRLEAIASDEFDRRLGLAYQSDSSEAMEMVEGLGDEMDLASLADSVPETEDLLEQEGDAPIIRLINALLTEAVKDNASDIHVETYEKRLVVRFRVDGVLREVVQPKRALAPLLVSRIKVMAKLDIAEKRVPQDGRIALRIGGREVDVRVSTMPSSHGERVVMRLLDKQAGRLSLAQLGMSDRDLRTMRNIISKPHGIILVTGPTGSGKTTTLYSSLKQLASDEINVSTIEDPIEMVEESFNQTQVQHNIDLDFAAGIRTLLRQDPDIIMVGEIRDAETARMATQAALTGHLVISTLHTNDAPTAVSRILDLGIPSYLIKSTLLGVMAQRLVRSFCPHCKKETEVSNADWDNLVKPWKVGKPKKIYEPGGCLECRNTGYMGRQGIYEILVLSDAMKEMVDDKCDLIKLRQLAMREGMRTLRLSGAQKVAAGITSLEEVLRVAPPPEGFS